MIRNTIVGFFLMAWASHAAAAECNFVYSDGWRQNMAAPAVKAALGDEPDFSRYSKAAAQPKIARAGQIAVDFEIPNALDGASIRLWVDNCSGKVGQVEFLTNIITGTMRR